VTAEQLIAVAAAVMFASFVQVSAGFGFGLLAVPVMTLAIEPREAIVVSTLIGVCVSGWQTWHLREHVDHPSVRRMTPAAYAGMPLGLWVFIAVDDQVLRFALGIAVLIAVVLLAVRIDVHHVGPTLELGGGFVSGILNTSLSTNGPPLVFVLQARGLGADPFRGTISRIFAWSAIGALVGFVAFGKVTQDGLIATAVALPAMILGQAAGTPVRRHVHGDRMRWLVLVLLTIAGLSAIAAAFR
jgi:uncharacterized protein